MDAKLILWPVLVQIILTILVYLKLARVKRQEYAAGNVDRERTALHQEAWPDSVVKINNNIRNQFETPVLFYILCLIFWGLNAVSALVLGLAWAYAICRLVHAYVHTTSNYVPVRFKVFLLSALILMIMAGLAIWTLAMT